LVAPIKEIVATGRIGQPEQESEFPYLLSGGSTEALFLFGLVSFHAGIEYGYTLLIV